MSLVNVWDGFRTKCGLKVDIENVSYLSAKLESELCRMYYAMYTEIDLISIGCLGDWALWTSWGVSVNRASLSLGA